MPRRPPGKHVWLEADSHRGLFQRLPVMLDINLMDEAGRLGLRIDVGALERALGVPVVATACNNGHGVEELKERIAGYVNGHGG